MAAGEPYTVEDIREIAKDKTSPPVWYYISGQTQGNRTAERNVKALAQHMLRPKLLKDVATRSISTTILGHQIDTPICMGPCAMHKLVNKDGEIATALAAQSMNTCYVTALFSSTSLEDIQSAAPAGLKWIQMLPLKYDWMMEYVVTKATAIGYQAIVLSLDQTFIKKSRAGHNLQTFQAMLPGIVTGQVLQEAANSRGDNHMSMDTMMQHMEGSDNDLFNLSWTWDDLRKFRKSINIPLVVKGVITAEDAIRAVECGADGILVSNHGGRHSDDLQATIDVLPEVILAVNGKCEVYIDGGFRTGNDVMKALALGARAVFIAQPVMWGLAYNGEEGVKKTMEILNEELDNNMALMGARSVPDIVADMVIRERC